MIQEFRDFINRGNVIDLAVAVVLGAAFAPVVGSVVDRIMMPIIGLIFGQPNFDTVGTFACEAGLDPEAGVAVGDEICAGSFGAVITAIITFLLVTLAMFLVVKAYNRMKGPEELAEEPGPSDEAILLAEIRDQLASRPMN